MALLRLELAERRDQGTKCHEQCELVVRLVHAESKQRKQRIGNGRAVAHLDSRTVGNVNTSSAQSHNGSEPLSMFVFMHALQLPLLLSMFAHSM